MGEVFFGEGKGRERVSAFEKGLVSGFASRGEARSGAKDLDSFDEMAKSDIEQAWELSEVYGVSRDTSLYRKDAQNLSADEGRPEILEGLNSPFLCHVRRTADRYLPLINQSALILGVGDALGNTLYSKGSPLACGAAAELLGVFGNCWSIEMVGCNAVGITVRTARPSLVRGEEHFLRVLNRWNGCATPVLDERGRIAGILSLGSTDTISGQELAFLCSLSDTATATWQNQQLLGVIRGFDAEWLQRFRSGELANAVCLSSPDLREAEKRCICEAVALAEGNMTEAASLLGISRATLYRRIKEYGLFG